MDSSIVTPDREKWQQSSDQTLRLWPSSAATSKLSGSCPLRESMAGRRRCDPSRGILKGPRRDRGGHEAAAVLHDDDLAGTMIGTGAAVNAHPEDTIVKKSAMARTILVEPLISGQARCRREEKEIDEGIRKDFDFSDFRGRGSEPHPKMDRQVVGGAKSRHRLPSPVC